MLVNRKEIENFKDILSIHFFCIKNNKEETKMLKFSQNIPLIEFNESLVINIEANLEIILLIH